MQTELMGEYENKEVADIVLIRSTPMKVTKETQEHEYLKIMYMKNTFDESGFKAKQIQVFSNDDGAQAVIAYGRHINGLSQIHVHEVGSRLAPHLSTITSIYVGIDGVKEWAQEQGLNGDSVIGRIETMMLQVEEE